MRQKRLEAERLFKEQAANDRTGVEGMAIELAKMKEARALAILRRILNAELARAWSQWVQQTAAAREKKRLTGGILNVMVGRYKLHTKQRNCFRRVS
jgi:hypothetical protein